MSNEMQAAKIEELLATEELPPEAAERLRAIVGNLRQDPGVELLPPNIPVDGKALRRQMEQSGDPVLVKLAKQIPVGHPGVDYHDTADREVTHEASRVPTAQGRVIPEALR